MTEPGTAVAAGRLLPAACPPGPKAVTRPSLSELSLGKLGRATGRCGGGESSPPPHTPPSWAPAAWGGGGEAAGPGIQAGRGAGVIRELTADRKGPRPPRVRMAGQLVAEGPRRGKLGGRLGDAGSSWGGGEPGGSGGYLLDKLAQVFTQGLTAGPLALSVSIQGVGAGRLLVGGAGRAGGREMLVRDSEDPGSPAPAPPSEQFCAPWQR